MRWYIKDADKCSPAEYDVRKARASREVAVTMKAVRESTLARKDPLARKHVGMEETLHVTKALWASENPK